MLYSVRFFDLMIDWVFFIVLSRVEIGRACHEGARSGRKYRLLVLDY